MAIMDLKVLIVGGGSSGLALGQGLKTAGINYTIFERDTMEDYTGRPRDWGFLLHWGADYLEQVLPPALFARLDDALVDPSYEGKDTPVHCNGKTGEILRRIPGGPTRRFSRRKLRLLLAEGLHIEFGKRLSRVSTTNSTVKVTFEDGSEEVGDLLIGCDGSKSKVREFLVGVEGAKGVDTGFTMMNFAASYTAEQARLLRSIPSMVTLGYHPDSSVTYFLAILDCSQSDKPETWKFQNFTCWKGPPTLEDLKDPAVRMNFFKSRAAEFCDPWRTAGMCISDDMVLPVDPGLDWTPCQWDNRRGLVTIAGDAAHSMLPHRGQGLNNAMQDAASLVKNISAVIRDGKPLQEAVNAYEEEMRPRAAKEVRLTLEQANLANDYKTVEQTPMFKVGLNKVEEKKVD